VKLAMRVTSRAAEAADRNCEVNGIGPTTASYEHQLSQVPRHIRTKREQDMRLARNVSWELPMCALHEEIVHLGQHLGIAVNVVDAMPLPTSGRHIGPQSVHVGLPRTDPSVGWPEQRGRAG
jgi:hypothetical protein